jgi:nucleotide-binding universal stress UspA family protein
MEIRQILAPTDFSESSKQAVTYAYALAQKFGARLLLLHIVQELPPYIGYIPPAGAATVLEHVQGQARLDLAELVPNVKGVPVEVTCQAVIGTPYVKIVEIAQEEKANLIVMATHGRTGFRHFIMGSVAERVVRTAPCSVLTIRPTLSRDRRKALPETHRRGMANVALQDTPGRVPGWPGVLALSRCQTMPGFTAHGDSHAL